MWGVFVACVKLLETCHIVAKKHTKLGLHLRQPLQHGLEEAVNLEDEQPLFSAGAVPVWAPSPTPLHIHSCLQWKI